MRERATARIALTSEDRQRWLGTVQKIVCCRGRVNGRVRPGATVGGTRAAETAVAKFIESKNK